MEKPIVHNVEECPSCKIPKGWGEEVIIINDELYCGKILRFLEGAKFSMHYHLIKDETWYVNSGEFIYRWIDTLTAEVNEQKLTFGDVVRQRPGQPHQLECLESGEIFEVSTQHFDDDSYQLEGGLSKVKYEDMGKWDV